MNTVEVGKVRIDLQCPVGLCNDNGPDVDPTDRGAQKRLVLDPSNDVMQSPRHDDASRC
jgi:hypothetical protein